MAVVNGPQFPLVTFGKPVLLGLIKTATDVLQFSLPNRTDYHLGHLMVQAVPNGTVTTFTANIAFALNIPGTGQLAGPASGVAATFNSQAPAGGSTLASTTAGLNFQTTPLFSVALPGIGGQVACQFQAATLTLGTATQIEIWALIG